MFATQRNRELMNSYKPPADIMKLQELSSSFNSDTGDKEFDLGDGKVSALTNLMNNDDVAVVNAIVPDGATFPVHDHIVYEWVIPYMGVMKVDTGGGVLMIGPDKERKYIVFQPGEPHSISAIGDVGVIGITVPADEGYPGAER